MAAAQCAQSLGAGGGGAGARERARRAAETSPERGAAEVPAAALEGLGDDGRMELGEFVGVVVEASVIGAWDRL